MREETIKYLCDICGVEIDIMRSYDVHFTFGSAYESGAFHIDKDEICFDCFSKLENVVKQAFEELTPTK